MSRRLYLVAYDVRHPKRLSRAIHILKDYASAGQKSVFECWLSFAEKRTLKNRLNTQLDMEKDSVLFTPLKKEQAVRTLGIAPTPEDVPFVYLG